MAHWTDELRTDLQKELASFTETSKGVFGELHSPTKPVSARDRVNDFLQMDTFARQQLALQLGPEGYKEFVDSRMDDAMQVIGPAAANLYTYFAQDMNQPEAVLDDPFGLDLGPEVM